MGYYQALEAAGAKVHSFEQFGSYQGDWWALLTFNGVTGWVNGSYGSCSGCDAFEGEMGSFSSHYHGEKYVWGLEDMLDGCENCQTYKIKLAEFGMAYLGNILSQEDALVSASRWIEWDMDAKEMVEYISTHGISDLTNV